MILINKIYLNLLTIPMFCIIFCTIFCTNCSNNIHNHHKVVKQPTGYLFANRDTLLMQGHATNFVEGYIDGCKSGQNRAGDRLFEYMQNETRFNIERDYTDGWKQGELFCFERMRDLIKNNQGYPDPYYSKESLEREKARIWSELRK